MEFLFSTVLLGVVPSNQGIKAKAKAWLSFDELPIDIPDFSTVA